MPTNNGIPSGQIISRDIALTRIECEGAARSIGWVDAKDYNALENIIIFWKSRAEKAEAELAELRAKQPEKLTGLTHAEAERLMKETPGRVAFEGAAKRRWSGKHWEDVDMLGDWRLDPDSDWHSDALWSIEPLPIAAPKPDDGPVELGNLKVDDLFYVDGLARPFRVYAKAVGFVRVIDSDDWIESALPTKMVRRVPAPTFGGAK